MKRWFPREVLRFVDAWACREGTPEDDEDANARTGLHDEVLSESGRCDHGRGRDDGMGLSSSEAEPGLYSSGMNPIPKSVHELYENDVTREWVELDICHTDEELGRDMGRTQDH